MRRIPAAVAVASCACAAGVANADVVFNDGPANDDAGSATRAVIVADNPLGPTVTSTQDDLAGASGSAGRDLTATGSSIVRIHAGSLVGDDMHATGSGVVTITGGSIRDDIRARDLGVVHLHGGSTGDSVAPRDRAALDIFGQGVDVALGAIAADRGVVRGFPPTRPRSATRLTVALRRVHGHDLPCARRAGAHGRRAARAPDSSARAAAERRAGARRTAQRRERVPRLAGPSRASTCMCRVRSEGPAGISRRAPCRSMSVPGIRVRDPSPGSAGQVLARPPTGTRPSSRA